MKIHSEIVQSLHRMKKVRFKHPSWLYRIDKDDSTIIASATGDRQCGNYVFRRCLPRRFVPVFRKNFHPSRPIVGTSLWNDVYRPHSYDRFPYVADSMKFRGYRLNVDYASNRKAWKFESNIRRWRKPAK